MATRPAQYEGRVLTDEQRSALTRELFALWHTLQPRAHHCFCGDDRALVQAVAHARRRVTERAPDVERARRVQRSGVRSRTRTPGRDGSGGA
jgi:hypothetical protein